MNMDNADGLPFLDDKQVSNAASGVVHHVNSIDNQCVRADNLRIFVMTFDTFSVIILGDIHRLKSPSVMMPDKCPSLSTMPTHPSIFHS